MADIIDSFSTSEISIEQIKSDILALRERLDSSVPLGELLVRIHGDLYKKPECFAVLSDEEISILIKGIQHHTRREIAVGKEKARAKKTFSMEDLDLG